MDNNFYTVGDKKREEFYKIPKDLFILPKYANLTNEARMLYGILRDRLTVSIKNKWIDEDGYVYFNYSRQSIADLLMVSLNTAKSRFKELKDVNLLIEKKVDNGQHLKLYLLKIVVENEIINNDYVENNNCEELEKRGSNIDGGQNLTGSDIGLGGGQNLGSSKTNIVRLNIYSHFNSKNITVHRQLNKNISYAINNALKIYSEEQIIQAIDNYAEVHNSKYFYNYKWPLDKFLKQSNGISEFLESGSVWTNYKSNNLGKEGLRVNQPVTKTTEKSKPSVNIILEDDM